MRLCVCYFLPRNLMKKNARDNLAKFFYDAARLSLAVLVIGLIARPPFKALDLILGITFTLSFMGVGIMIDFVPVEEK